MSLMVKICGLKTATDAGVVAAAGADAAGFVFAESVRRVSPENAAEAADALPDDVLRVAVMKHPSDAEWQAVLETFSPDVLQTDAGDYAALDVPDDIRRWPVFREGSIVDMASMPPEFLYEGPRSGSGETVDWAQAAELARRGHMLLAGGLSPANVAAAVRAVRPWGVDVSSGVESAPGVKDSQKIREFIRAARAAE
jgi:phosphoribosylanthranilate isomerase